MLVYSFHDGKNKVKWSKSSNKLSYNLDNCDEFLLAQTELFWQKNECCRTPWHFHSRCRKCNFIFSVCCHSSQPVQWAMWHNEAPTITLLQIDVTEKMMKYLPIWSLTYLLGRQKGGRGLESRAHREASKPAIITPQAAQTDQDGPPKKDT